jgi:choline dehydrogenase-like flavoprotein
VSYGVLTGFQTWRPSKPENDDHYRTFDLSIYNTSAGPGILGYTNYNPPSIDAFVESLPSIGIPISVDLNSGNNIGGKHELSTMNPITQTRISSYTAFWHIAVQRPNFKAITFATVERILFEDQEAGEPKAVGAEYSTVVNGEKQKHIVYADKEVILSAGAIKTPQLLMLSVCLAKSSSRY